VVQSANEVPSSNLVFTSRLRGTKRIGRTRTKKKALDIAVIIVSDTPKKNYCTAV
jgi:hypothetical protein